MYRNWRHSLLKNNCGLLKHKAERNNMMPNLALNYRFRRMVLVKSPGFVRPVYNIESVHAYLLGWNECIFSSCLESNYHLYVPNTDCLKCLLNWKNKARKAQGSIEGCWINASFGFCLETLLDLHQTEMVIPTPEFPHCRHEQTETQLSHYRPCLAVSE